MPLRRSIINSNASMPGWYQVFNDNVGHLVGIDLQNDSANKTFRTTALQHHSVHDMWTAMINGNFALAIKASAWTGLVNVTLPIVSTVCVSAINNGTFDTVWTEGPAANSSVFEVYIGPVSDSNFTGANCSVQIRQGHFRKFSPYNITSLLPFSLSEAVSFWDFNQGTISISLTNYNNPSWLTSHAPNPLNTPTYLFPSSPGDDNIAALLSGHISNIFYNLEGLIQRGQPLSHHLYNLSTSMTTIGRADITNSAEGYTPIIGTIVALLLTQATWLVSPFPDGSQATHGPVQWQTYGSGPRLVWEWLAALIFCGIVLVIFVDLSLIFWKRIGEVRWKEPGALLEIERRVVKVEDQKWVLRESENKGVQGEVKVVMTNDLGWGKFLRKGVAYKWKDD